MERQFSTKSPTEDTRVPELFQLKFSSSRIRREGDALNLGDVDRGVVSDTISSLLEEPYYLERVLRQCPPETLRSCRRVCRRWRDASKQLPLALSERHWWKTADLLECFPCAASVSIQLLDDEHPKDVLRTLAAARNLESLRLRSWKPWTQMYGVSTHLSAFKRLRDLNLEWCNEEQGADVFAALGALTNLTCLRISSVAGKLSDLQHLAALQHLEQLDLQFLFMEKPEEQVVLPFLPSMTHLSIGTTYAAGIESELNVLKVDLYHPPTVLCLRGRFCEQMISPYASTLRYLRLSEIHMSGPVQDFSLLGSFKQLEHFSFHCSYSDAELEEGTHFFHALRQLPGIQTLELYTGACLSSVVLDAVSRMTHLQCLSYQPLLMESNSDPVPKLSTLTQLTHFSLSCAPVGFSLDGLTSLVELSIQNCAQNIVGLEAALCGMSHLERLSLGFDKSAGTAIFSRVLPQLKNLKSFQLCGALLDPGPNP